MQYVSRLLDPTRLQRHIFSTEIRNQSDIDTRSMPKKLRVIFEIWATHPTITNASRFHHEPITT